LIETIEPEASPRADPFQYNVFPIAYNVCVEVAGDVDGSTRPREAVASPVIVRLAAVVVAR
jgi:hypothetical protein